VESIRPAMLCKQYKSLFFLQLRMIGHFLRAMAIANQVISRKKTMRCIVFFLAEILLTKKY